MIGAPSTVVSEGEVEANVEPRSGLYPRDETGLPERPEGKEKQKVIMEEKFEYVKAIEELEAIAAKVEDSSTGIGEIDKYMKRSQELIEACRAYLRGARETLNNGGGM